MRFNNFCLSLATLSFIGYLPASGTMGSIVAFILYILLNYTLDYLGLFKLKILIIFLIIILAFFIIKKTLYILNIPEKADPKEIVIDEVAGCFIALYNLNNFNSLVLAFLAFRFFDITKILGIKKIEKLNGAMGILLDDIVAGVYANILIKVLYYYGFI